MQRANWIRSLLAASMCAAIGASWAQGYLVVPYKGSAPAYQDFVGGRIDGFIDPILGSMQYSKGGLLKVIAVTSRSRLPSMADVPTVAESIEDFVRFQREDMARSQKLVTEANIHGN